MITRRIFYHTLSCTLFFLILLSIWCSFTPHRNIFLSTQSEEWKSLEELRLAILDYGVKNNHHFPSKCWFDKNFPLSIKSRPTFIPYEGYVSDMQNGGGNKIVAYIEVGERICVLYNADMRRPIQEMSKKEFYLAYLKKILHESKMLELSRDNILSDYGISPLHYSLLFEESCDNIICSDLLNKGDCNGFTPLMYAVILGKIDVVKKMLSIGALIEHSNFLNDNVTEIAFIINRELYNILLSPNNS